MKRTVASFRGSGIPIELAAAEAGISVEAIIALIRRRRIFALRVGDSWLISESVIDDLPRLCMERRPLAAGRGSVQHSNVIGGVR